ncbi:MAG: hypothetical protein DRP59_12930 [Spirochaetes bacterium]|nr:MAG: hypothetical protein DRP59_12930 [Spirochaetota bacterium]
MSELAEIITGEFTDAVEVKNPESLKRGIFLLLSSTLQKEEHKMQHDGLKESIAALNSNVQLIATRMEEGFKRVDERFEASDKRFESIQQQMNRRFDAVDKKFNRETTLMTIGFLAITTLITVYRFLG